VIVRLSEHRAAQDGVWSQVRPPSIPRPQIWNLPADDPPSALSAKRTPSSPALTCPQTCPRMKPLSIKYF